jgi:P4 family phage/plasmid primase-like protien
MNKENFANLIKIAHNKTLGKVSPLNGLGECDYGEYKRDADILINQLNDDSDANGEGVSSLLSSWSTVPGLKEIVFPILNQINPALIAHKVTEKGHAKCVVSVYSDTLRHCDSVGWVMYINNKWSIVPNKTVFDTVSNLLEERQNAFLTLGEIGKSGACDPTASRINNVLTHIPGMLSSDFDKDFNKEVYKLVAKNGVINMETGELLPHSPKYKLTHMVKPNYNPHACFKAWERFLYDTIQDWEIVKYLQVLVGYIFSGSRDLDTMLYLWDDKKGRTGKGVFTETLCEILGDDLAVDIKSKYFYNDSVSDMQFVMARCVGARLIDVGEIKSKTIDCELIKDITGARTFSYCHKFRKPTQANVQFTLIFSSNHPLKMDGSDPSAWGRVASIEFKKSHHGKENPNFRYIWSEGDFGEGVLNWAIKGFMEFCKYKRLGEIPPRPANMMKAQKIIQDSNNKVGVFLGGKDYVITGDKGHIIPSQQLFNEFREWTSDNGYSHTGISKNFYDSLKSMGAILGVRKTVNGTKINYIGGIKRVDTQDTKKGDGGEQSTSDLPFV